MDLHVVVDGKQVDSVVDLGRTVLEDGGGSKEAQRRLQAGAAAGRRDRKLEKQLKGNCVGSLRGTSSCICVESTCSDIETGRKARGSR